jgi:hypothetical protein
MIGRYDEVCQQYEAAAKRGGLFLLIHDKQDISLSGLYGIMYRMGLSGKRGQKCEA